MVRFSRRTTTHAVYSQWLDCVMIETTPTARAYRIQACSRSIEGPLCIRIQQYRWFIHGHPRDCVCTHRLFGASQTSLFFARSYHIYGRRSKVMGPMDRTFDAYQCSQALCSSARWEANVVAELGDRGTNLFGMILAYLSTLIYSLTSAGSLLDSKQCVRFLVGC